MHIIESSVAVLALSCTLSACSGGSVGVAQVLAGPDPITDADFVGKTFPLRFAGLDSATFALFRGTGSVRVISLTELEVSVNGVSDALTAFVPGVFSGTSLGGEQAVLAPALSALGLDGTTDSYLGVYGFETAPASMPNSLTVPYRSIGTTSLAFLSDGTATGTVDGTAELFVDFGGGVVSGQLFRSAGNVFELRNGLISGNGFSGAVQAYRAVAGGFIEAPTSNSAVDAVFFGNDAGVLAGTYRARYDDGILIDVVGTFAAQD